MDADNQTLRLQDLPALNLTKGHTEGIRGGGTNCYSSCPPTHVCPVALWIQTIAKNSANKEEETLTLSQKCRQLHFLLCCNNKQFKYFLKIHISISTICPKKSFICWWHTYLQHILECVSYLVGIWKKWCILIFQGGRLKSMHYILNILNMFSFFQLMKELVCVKWD